MYAIRSYYVQTPCYLISEDVVRRNCELLDTVQQRTGAKILQMLMPVFLFGEKKRVLWWLAVRVCT